MTKFSKCREHSYAIEHRKTRKLVTEYENRYPKNTSFLEEGHSCCTNFRLVFHESRINENDYLDSFDVRVQRTLYKFGR